MAFHKTLREAREHAGLSLEKAAKCIGISGASFSRMENGRSKVTINRLEQLAALYELSPSELVAGNLVSAPSTVDIDRLRLVVEVVQRKINAMKVKPSPEKMGLVVSEIYRMEIELLVKNAEAEFNPSRHEGLIEAMFRK